MERRVAIKQMALTAGGLLVMPAWAHAWTKTSVQPLRAMLEPTQAEILTELVDTLIPASDTLGAKALGVSEFVQKMLADCYEAPVQENVRTGLDAVNALANERFNQSFVACDSSQRTEVLKTIEIAPETNRKDFYALVKNLTIQGFTTSEYVMTTYLHYNMIPGHYYGCVPAPTANR